MNKKKKWKFSLKIKSHENDWKLSKSSRGNFPSSEVKKLWKSIKMKKLVEFDQDLLVNFDWQIKKLLILMSETPKKLFTDQALAVCCAANGSFLSVCWWFSSRIKPKTSKVQAQKTEIIYKSSKNDFSHISKDRKDLLRWKVSFLFSLKYWIYGRASV